MWIKIEVKLYSQESCILDNWTLEDEFKFVQIVLDYPMFVRKFFDHVKNFLENILQSFPKETHDD